MFDSFAHFLLLYYAKITAFGDENKHRSMTNNSQVCILQILDSSKSNEIADDNFIVDDNGGKFSERVANTGEKENCLTEISKDSYCRHIKKSLFGKV